MFSIGEDERVSAETFFVPLVRLCQHLTQMLSVGALGIVPIGITALIALGGCGNGDDGGPSAEPLAALRPTDQSAFDSSEHPDLSELSAVVAGLFLPDSGLALVERSEIHLIDLLSGGTRVVGREGEGPREFRHIGRARRVPGGILVSDVPRRRVSLISHKGEFLRSRSVVDAEFGDYFGAYPVGVHPDGRIAFRDGIAEMGRDYDGQTWNPAVYVTVRDDGELQIVAEAAGDEVYFGSTRSGDVVFGHQTHEAATEDHLIVAETSRGAIAVLDWSGREVAEIPLPAGARVSDARTVGRQVLLGRWQRFRERLNRLGATGQIPFKPRDFDPSGASEPGEFGTSNGRHCSSRRESVERKNCSMDGATWCCFASWTSSMFPEQWPFNSWGRPTTTEDH